MSGGAAWAEAEADRPPSPLARVAAGLRAAVAAVLTAERERWLLWLPPLFGSGIGAYFALASEPAAWAAPSAMLLAVATGAILRRKSAILVGAIGVAVIAAGMTLAQWRAHHVAAPVLERRLGPVDLEGRVVAVDIRAEGRRIVLDRLDVSGLAPAKTPATVRVRVRQASTVHAGDRVAMRAILLPPPAPAAPGAYDFPRQAWFDRLGGVGYSVGEVRRLEGDAGASSLRVWVNRTRQDVVERVLAAVPGPAGAIVAALLTGEQGTVPPDVMEWMRDSGLAHLLSVSGLHVGLVATIVFVAVRRSLALVPRIALHYPIKKWAAFAAFVAITLYLLFVAPGVPIQRAWLMTSVVLFAVVIDRTAISMRLVAWAAFAVLVIAPESLLGPSFQMSFAAVVALIAAWEATRARFMAWRSQSGMVRRTWIALVGVAMTSLVASLATAPYALFHFNRFAAYGLVANLLAVPLTGLWVMPWAVVAFILLPFGLEAWALVPMGWGAAGIVAIARVVASWDGAAGLWPAMPAWGLATVTCGGLWLCLWQTRWRLAGVAIIVLGMASTALERAPDILVSGDGRLLAVRGVDGLLQLSSDRPAKLTRETWLRRAGQSETPPVWPKVGRSDDGALSCDAASCLYTMRGHVAALIHDVSALADDCRHANVVVATVPVRRRCQSAAIVIDRFALWRDGGHALWLDRDGARVESVRTARGDRPWVAPVPPPRNRRDAAGSEGQLTER
jgi:competence protein ComEC